MTDDAFGAMLLEHRPVLQQRATRLLQGRGDPEDLASQAIANAWSAYRLGRYVERGHLLAFLQLIVSRLVLDWLRAEKATRWSVSLDETIFDAVRGMPVTLADVIPSKEDVEGDVITRALLAEAWGHLNQYQRWVLLGMFHAGSQHAAAARLGLSEPAVEGVLHRARRRARSRAGLPKKPAARFVYR